ncbi:hypothetical protein ACFY6U_51855 [Streptomyces sp. NPDC013157]|uniref:hypothetical protein n=1 Tax=Streptomyces sp. NPDC013157 TaxID=3364861 RepID=UPI0036A42A0F
MACGTGNGAGDIIKGFFDFLGDPIGTILEVIANKVLGAAITVFGDLVTSIPTLSTDTAGAVNEQTQWIVVYGAVASLLFAAGRMAIERRGEAGGVALKGLLRVLLVAGGATAVMTALASLADRYADHLFATGAQAQLNTVTCADPDRIQSVVLLVLALLLLIAAIVQTILMYVRLGVMIILLGTLPVAAAASMTNWGAGWWRKHIGWMIAWLLYKPAAGLVIFAGSAMISNGTNAGGDGVQEKIAGIGVLLLSAVALPALLKLVVPATAGLGSGGSGGVGAVTGALASGARSIGGASGGGGGGGAMPGQPGAAGGTGAAGPSGARGAGGGGASGGAGGASGGAGAAGTRAAAAAGPVGAAVAAGATVVKAVGNMAAGAVDGADGDHGHHR